MNRVGAALVYATGAPSVDIRLSEAWFQVKKALSRLVSGMSFETELSFIRNPIWHIPLKI